MEAGENNNFKPQKNRTAEFGGRPAYYNFLLLQRDIASFNKRRNRRRKTQPPTRIATLLATVSMPFMLQAGKQSAAASCR